MKYSLQAAFQTQLERMASSLNVIEDLPGCLAEASISPSLVRAMTNIADGLESLTTIALSGLSITTIDSEPKTSQEHRTSDLILNELLNGEL